MDSKILPLFLWIGLLSIYAGGQRIPPPPPQNQPQPQQIPPKFNPNVRPPPPGLQQPQQPPRQPGITKPQSPQSPPQPHPPLQKKNIPISPLFRNPQNVSISELYALQDDSLKNISGTTLGTVVRLNRGDTTIAFKFAEALEHSRDDQDLFLSAVGDKILPDVQRLLIDEVLEWWGNPTQWGDREFPQVINSGDPILAYVPPSKLEELGEEEADRMVNVLGSAPNAGKRWWMKPMSIKKTWFELAKRARFFGAVHEWSEQRMRRLSFLLEGASPEDLHLVPNTVEIKNMVIGNHYSELQAQVVFDAFYSRSPLTQDDLQEFQFHILDLTPTQLQRFDLADSFSSLEDMLMILENQRNPSYPSLLQISYYMWPLVNMTQGQGLVMAAPNTWQKRELSQIGKFLFLMPKSTLFQLPREVFNFDSTSLQTIQSKHLSRFQIWTLTAQILQNTDDHMKPDYIFMMPPPFQKGIPTENISQALLATPQVKPEVIKTLIETSTGMLTSQKSVIAQRIRHRLNEGTILRHILSSSKPADMFDMFGPKQILTSIPSIIKTLMDMPETGKFGVTQIQAKLLPRQLLSLWLNWVRERNQLRKWTAEDLLGRSAVGLRHTVSWAILGLTCRDVDLIEPLDILPVILHYRHELYGLRTFNPELEFHLSLRPCFLDKVVQYLKTKRILRGNQSESHILSDLTAGEIMGIGGEILSLIPTRSLENLSPKIRMKILEEIGELNTLDLFHLVPLQQVQWYANTLFKDIINIRNTPTSRLRRQMTPSSNTTTDPSSTPTDRVNGTAPTTNQTTVIEGRATPDTEGESPDPTEDQAEITDPPNPTSEDTSDVTSRNQDDSEMPASAFSPTGFVDSDTILKLGNLFCYADNTFNGNWSVKFFKDTLESKALPGEKTCCVPKAMRRMWFNLLQNSYGRDTSTWSEFDLAAIGDLLINVPEQDLAKISKDTLAKAYHPILTQSGFDILITVPGEIKKMRFISVCVSALGTEGAEMFTAYKQFMRQVAQGAQAMVNTVKTTEDLIKNALGRTGRLPRWAEFTLIRNSRQIPILTATNKVQPGQGQYYSSVQSQRPLPATQVGIQEQGQFAAAGQGQINAGVQAGQFPAGQGSIQGQGQFAAAGQGQINAGSQAAQFSAGQSGIQGQGQFNPGLQNQFTAGQSGIQGQGQFAGTGQGQFNPNLQAQGQFPAGQSGIQGQGQFAGTGQAQFNPAVQAVGQLPAAQGGIEQGQFAAAGQGQLNPGVQGQISARQIPVAQSVIQGQGQFAEAGQGQLNLGVPGQGQFAEAGQGQLNLGVQSQGQFPASQGQFPASQGQFPASQGQFPASQGQFPASQGQYYPGVQSQGQFPASQGQYYPGVQSQRQFPTSQVGIQDQGQFAAAGQGQFNTGVPGQGQFAAAGQGQFNSDVQADQFPAVQSGIQGQGQFTETGQGQFNPSVQGQFPAVQSGIQGQGQFGGTGQGQFNPAVQGQAQFPTGRSGQFSGTGQGQFNPSAQGQFPAAQSGIQGQGQFVGTGQGQFNSGMQGQRQFPAAQGGIGQGQFAGTGQGQFNPGVQGQGQFAGTGQGQFNSGVQGQGQFSAGQGGIQGQGQFPAGIQGQGQFPVGQTGIQGQGQFPAGQGSLQGQGQFPVGQTDVQGQGQFPASGQGFGAGGQQQDQFLDLTARGINATDPMMKNGTKPQSGGSDAALDERARSLDFDSGSGIPQRSQQRVISCDGIKAAGPAAIGWSLQDLQQLSSNDLFDCIEALGLVEWDEQTKVGILNLAVQKLKLTTERLRTLTLIELGNLVTAMKPSADGQSTTIPDVSKMNMTIPASFDVLSILGSKITDPVMLKVLAERFNEDNQIFPGLSRGIQRPENLRIAVNSLGNILCGFTDKIVNSIFESDAALFVDASPTLGMLEGCSMEVLSTLATFAIRPSNYGPPKLWTQEYLETIGVVFAGLKPEAISTINPDAMPGLQPHAVKSLPPSAFLALTSEQISKMSYNAAKSVLSVQRNSLSSSQLAALETVTEFNVGSDDVRLEGTRALHPNGTEIIGRTKGNDDPDTTETPDTNSTTEATTTTEVPEFKGETSPSGAGRALSSSVLMLPCIVILSVMKLVNL